MRTLVLTLARINALVVVLVKAAVVIMAIGMVAAIVWQVGMRYLFHRPPSWTEELALLLFSWSMLLMLAVGVKELFHVKVNLADAVLPARLNEPLKGVIDLFITAFGGYLLWAGILYCSDMSGSRSAAIGYPIVLLYGIAPVCGGLILLFGLEHILRRLIGMPVEPGLALHQHASHTAGDGTGNDSERGERT